MEDFNLKGLDSVQLNEIYFKVKKLMEIIEMSSINSI